MWSGVKTVWSDIKTVWSDVIDGVEWCNKEPILVGREPIIYIYICFFA